MKCNTDISNRLLFDQVAKEYDRVRPPYPTELFERIAHYAGLTESFTVLEIGCGTGQATLPIARLGVHILAIDPGASLLELARANLAAYPNATFRNCFFEDLDVPTGYFDLVISGTAFHWIPSEIAYPKTAQLLKPEGTLALFWNMLPTFDQSVEDGLRDIFDRYCPGLSDGTFGEVSQLASDEGIEELLASNLYKMIERESYEWSIRLTGVDFTSLLSTFANFQALPEEIRTSIFDAVAAWINSNLGGTIECHYCTLLHLCKRR